MSMPEIWRSRLVLAVLALTVILTEPVARRYGDRFQNALPVLGLGCAVLNGSWAEYMLRYAIGLGVVEGSKSALGDLPLNMRPTGNPRGFPSGHTAAAAFGASYLAHDCVANSPVARTAVILAAGFTGASRIDAGVHTIWQVLAGAIVGLLGDRLFRRNGPGRRAVIAPFRWLARRFKP